ncbi:MAG: NAD-dependent epimerase/dehydratase family protein [Planctomycetota bacterium]
MSGVEGKRVLVTGATGFLGGAVAKALHAAGAHIVAHGRSACAAADLERQGLEVWLSSLEDRASVAAFLAKTPPELVVHSAALSAPFGPREAFVRSNVDATATVLEASERAGVTRFVHVSTPAIYSSGRPLVSVREDATLPPRAINHYAATKRIAESLVQSANGRGLPTVILRPRAIYGPGDRALFPRLVRALEAGRLPIIGDGRNRIDLTYIDDAVHGVERALLAGEQALGGVYNLTGPEPAALWEVIERLCVELDLPRPGRRVSHRAARAAALAAETLHRLLRRKGEPALTRYSVDSLALDAGLDISAARRDLGYRPSVTVDEGVRRFLESLDDDRVAKEDGCP